MRDEAIAAAHVEHVGLRREHTRDFKRHVISSANLAPTSHALEATFDRFSQACHWRRLVQAPRLDFRELKIQRTPEKQSLFCNWSKFVSPGIADNRVRQFSLPQRNLKQGAKRQLVVPWFEFFSVHLCVLCVSVVVVCSIPGTTETQRTQRLHREIKLGHYPAVLCL